MDSDDVDIFTQQLMERTRKRRENLNKKINHTEKNSPSRKRSSPLREDNLINEDVEGKRYCEKGQIKCDIANEKIKFDDETLESSKENRSVTLQSRLQRLAKLHSSEEIDSPPSKPHRLYPDISSLMGEETTSFPELKKTHHCKSKLAALAATYNELQNDENTNSSLPSSQNNKTELSKKHDSSVNKTNLSSTIFERNVQNNTFESVLHGAKSPSKKSATSSSSFAEVLEKFQKPSNSGNKQRQGFVHSPSRSKLQYEFNKQDMKPEKEKTVNKLTDKVHVSNSSKIKEKKCEVPVPPPLPGNSCIPSPKKPVNSEVKTSAQSMPSSKLQDISKQAQTMPNSLIQEISKHAQTMPSNKIQEISKQLNVELHSNVKKTKPDPAELPLSARVALFEQATQVESAAAAASKIVTGLTPYKTSPVKKQPDVPISRGKVGKVTNAIHQQLFKNTAEWTKKEINSKIIEQRKKELIALNKREELNSSSEENAIIQQSKNTDQRDSIESDDSFESNSNSDEENDYDDSSEDNELVMTSKESKNLNYNSKINEYKGNECSEESEENISDFLDEALEANVSSSSDFESPSLKPPEKPARLPVNYENNLKHLDHGNRTQPPTYSTHTVNNAEEQLLMHSVSFYRRQKQETRLTPVRTIVRQEVRHPTTSNKIDVHSLIKEKIQALQEEINAQQIIISQTSQALNVCRSNADFYGSTEQVEGERLLLIATHKRQACIAEIQRLKTEGALGNGVSSQDGNSVGTLSIKNIQLYLKKDFLQQTDNGKTGDFVHFFIGLLKYRSQVISTQMMSTMDTNHGALTFPNLININELNSNFNVTFEIFGLQARRDQIAVDRYRTLSKKDKSKLNLTPKKLLSKQDSRMTNLPIESPGGPSAVRTSSFALIGYANINVKTMKRKIWVLEKVPFMSPLDGNMEMKIHCHSDFTVEERGFLTMFDDVSGFGAWHRRWCSIVGTTLSFWKYPDDEKRKEPIGFLDLRKCVTANVGLVPRDICARPNTFMLVTVRPPKEDDTDTLVSQTYGTYTALKHLLSADTKEERLVWSNTLNSVLNTIRLWDPEALRPFDNTHSDSD